MSDIIVDSVVKYYLNIVDRRTKEPVQKLELSGPAPIYPQYYHININGIRYVVRGVFTDISSNTFSGVTNYVTEILVDVCDLN